MMDLDYHKHFPEGGVGKQYEWLRAEFERRHIDKTNSILDYGCGKGGTALWLETVFPGITITRYDPYVQEYANFRDQYYDFVYTADVLEHIPQPQLDHAIAVINSVSSGPSIHIVDLDPAKKTLPDGRNAHLSLLTPEEWIKTFERKLRVQDAYIQEYPDRILGKRRRLHISATRGKKM